MLQRWNFRMFCKLMCMTSCSDICDCMFWNWLYTCSISLIPPNHVEIKLLGLWMCRPDGRTFFHSKAPQVTMVPSRRNAAKVRSQAQMNFTLRSWSCTRSLLPYCKLLQTSGGETNLKYSWCLEISPDFLSFTTCGPFKRNVYMI